MLFFVLCLFLLACANHEATVPVSFGSGQCHLFLAAMLFVNNRNPAYETRANDLWRQEDLGRFRQAFTFLILLMIEQRNENISKLIFQ